MGPGIRFHFAHPILENLLLWLPPGPSSGGYSRLTVQVSSRLANCSAQAGPDPLRSHKFDSLPASPQSSFPCLFCLSPWPLLLAYDVPFGLPAHCSTCSPPPPPHPAGAGKPSLVNPQVRSTDPIAPPTPVLLRSNWRPTGTSRKIRPRLIAPKSHRRLPCTGRRSTVVAV
jgi:hypothetical protein